MALFQDQILQKLRASSSSNGNAIWTPFPGKPQEQAYWSKADRLLYGGAAGGGKSDLLLGLAFTQHRRSLIFRQEFAQLEALVDRGNVILEPLGIRTSMYVHKWSSILHDGVQRMVRLAGVKTDADILKYQGQPHDLVGFDELTHFPEKIFRFIIGWNRTDVVGQRTRVVGASNPPLDLEQEWVIDYWAPWVDDDYTGTRAKPGELRWFVTRNNRDIEVDDGEPILFEGESIQPKSRTFIPAFVEDNPVYTATGYKAELQALPTELQAPLLKGIFRRYKGSHPYQVIPTQWVIDAMERSKHRAKPDLNMRAMGIDVARGGADETVLACLFGNWFAPLICLPGTETPDGDAVAWHVIDHYEGCKQVGIDVGGVGASPYDILKKKIAITPINSSSASRVTDQTGVYGFTNLRTQMWWQFREALDPENGHQICLPHNTQLRADLCAPRYRIVGADYRVETKDEIRLRLGRSPDMGDAVIMAWYMAGNSHAPNIWMI